jgi:uncharacterized protein with HEPN domain
MPFNSTQNALIDISSNIQLAREFVVGMSFEAFCAGKRTIYAVTRCLEIISEASRRLPADLKSKHPHLSWTDIAAAGNMYRHDYDDVTNVILWDTVQRHLGPLDAVTQQELSNLTPERP